MANRQSASPAALPSGVVRLDEISYNLGAEYSLGW
jgi:hypothetical protein